MADKGISESDLLALAERFKEGTGKLPHAFIVPESVMWQILAGMGQSEDANLTAFGGIAMVSDPRAKDIYAVDKNTFTEIMEELERIG